MSDAYSAITNAPAAGVESAGGVECCHRQVSPVRRAAPGLRAILLFVAVAGLLTNALSLVATRLWVYPDSIDYIQLAGGLVDRFDVGNELFLIRTPGYPVLLALIFRVFGKSSPEAIAVIQHLMAAATCVVGALLGHRLTQSRAVALLAGVFCAVSLQVLAYANLPLTETPYTLALVACVYCLVRYLDDGPPRWLAGASLLAGWGYLLRPVGLYLGGVIALAIVLRATKGTLRGSIARAHSWTRALAVACLAGILPALFLVAPWMAISSYYHGSLQANRCLDYVLYLRAVEFDRLDSKTSAAMLDVHAVVEEAVARGLLPSDADVFDRATVIRAYQAVGGVPFARSSAIMGQAARDLMREHWAVIAANTVRYAAWLILAPDPVYRFVPGGAPGQEGKRDPSAETYDIGTYAFGEGSWEWVLKDYRHHLPLSAAAAPLTSTWTSLATWFHRAVDRGAPIFGLADTRYEELMILCVASGIAGLIFARNRAAWCVVASAVGAHVLVSAFLSGPQTRYAVPIKPILLLYLAFGLRQTATCGWWLARGTARAMVAVCTGSEGLGRPARTSSLTTGEPLS
ncbi:MAG: glycosyltransferase family 39 protein [Planctomycetota bacterium]